MQDVVACPDGFQCGTNRTAPAASGDGQQSVCNPAAPTPITPTPLDVEPVAPECTQANFTCVSNVTYCFSGAHRGREQKVHDCIRCGFLCCGAACGARAGAWGERLHGYSHPHGPPPHDPPSPLVCPRLQARSSSVPRASAAAAPTPAARPLPSPASPAASPRPATRQATTQAPPCSRAPRETTLAWQTRAASAWPALWWSATPTLSAAAMRGRQRARPPTARSPRRRRPTAPTPTSRASTRRPPTAWPRSRWTARQVGDMLAYAAE